MVYSLKAWETTNVTSSTLSVTMLFSSLVLSGANTLTVLSLISDQWTTSNFILDRLSCHWTSLPVRSLRFIILFTLLWYAVLYSWCLSGMRGGAVRPTKWQGLLSKSNCTLVLCLKAIPTGKQCVRRVHYAYGPVCSQYIDPNRRHQHYTCITIVGGEEAVGKWAPPLTNESHWAPHCIFWCSCKACPLQLCIKKCHNLCERRYKSSEALQWRWESVIMWL